MMTAITDLTSLVAHIASGPPPAPPTAPGGGKGGGKEGHAADPLPGGRVSIPAPKGMHGVKEFDGKNYRTWKPAVKDHLTDDGRDEIGILLKWAEKQKEPITGDLAKTPAVPFHVPQASAEIYRAMGRVLEPDIGMKYRTNAGEGCGLEV